MFQTLRFGYVAALVCAVLAVLAGAFTYYDLQDEDFYEKLALLPPLLGTMAVVFALFPGGRFTFGEARKLPDRERMRAWVRDAPAAHKRVWLGGFLLSFYLGIWLRDTLIGEDFFSLKNQVISVLVALGIGFFVRRFAKNRDWI